MATFYSGSPGHDRQILSLTESSGLPPPPTTRKNSTGYYPRSGNRQRLRHLTVTCPPASAASSRRTHTQGSLRQSGRSRKLEHVRIRPRRSGEPQGTPSGTDDGDCDGDICQLDWVGPWRQSIWRRSIWRYVPWPSEASSRPPAWDLTRVRKRSTTAPPAAREEAVQPDFADRRGLTFATLRSRWVRFRRRRPQHPSPPLFTQETHAGASHAFRRPVLLPPLGPIIVLGGPPPNWKPCDRKPCFNVPPPPPPVVRRAPLLGCLLAPGFNIEYSFLWRDRDP